MQKEFRQDMAKMFSLMERMDSHMTISEANENKRDFLFEASMVGSGPLSPDVDMTIDTDDSNKTRVLKVWVRPLFAADINKLESIFDCETLTLPYTKADGTTVNMDGALFTKTLPFNKNAHTKKDPNALAQPTAQAQAQATQPAAPKLTGLAAIKARKAAQAAQNGGVVTEASIFNKIAAKKAAQNGGAPVPSTGTTQPATQTTATPTTTASNGQKVEDGIEKWLTSNIVAAAKMLQRNTNYDANALAKLTDIQYLIDKFVVAPNKKDKNYAEENEQQICEEVKEAIKSGNWSAISQTFSPVNLEALVFGNVLTGRNRRMIQRQADEYGLQPGDPGYPTNLYATGKFLKKFGRRLIDPNTARRYYVQIPRHNNRGTTTGVGSKGHYDEFGNQLRGFNGGYLYDISDTERIPASEYDKYGLDPNKLDPNIDYFNDVAGIANNLTGELNPHAIQAKSDAEAARKAALSDEQTKMLNAIQTDDGKAVYFNEALMAYATKNKMDASVFHEVTTSKQPIVDYARNIIEVCRFAIKKAGYANPKVIDPIIKVSAFAIGCKTVGANEVLTLLGGGGNVSQMLSDWETASKIMLGTVTKVVNLQIKSIVNKYSIFKDDTQNQQNGAQAAPATQNAQQQAAASPVVTENYDIEVLLKNLLV